MEFFERAIVVRLRSHHDKYLLAGDDKEGVFQDRNGTYKNAKWSVEIVEGDANLVRLKSCYEKYLTASNVPFLLGATGKKVIQTLPTTTLDSSFAWEPIREGVQVKLKTSNGQFLRANGRIPPWRNSVTHDIPYRTKSVNWILWDVDLVELRPIPPKSNPSSSSHIDSTPFHYPTYSNHNTSDDIYLHSPKNEDLEESSSPIKDGRIIFYNIGDKNGNVPNANEEKFFTFKGSVEELKEKFKKETGRDDIVVCCRNPLTTKLHHHQLQLPPNDADMHVVVVIPS